MFFFIGKSIPDYSPKLQKEVVSKDRFSSDFEPQYNLKQSAPSATACWNLSEIHKSLKGDQIVIAILDTAINHKHNAFKQGAASNRITRGNFVKNSDGQEITNLPPGTHGSMAAFIAGGDAFGGVPCGVAPKAKLLVCQVGEHNSYYKVAVVTEALQTLKTLRESGENELHVVSMSLGMPYDVNDKRQTKIKNLIEDLQALGVVCVAACGSYGLYESVLFPACLDSVISVGALDEYGHKLKSNPPKGVDVFAPGENIPAPSREESQPDGIVPSTGSSCATPAIAGLVALVIQYAHQYVPANKRAKFRKTEYLKNSVFGRKMKGQDKDHEDLLQPCKYFTERLNRVLPDSISDTAKSVITEQPRQSHPQQLNQLELEEQTQELEERKCQCCCYF